ncbi:GIY-YIG nuclease family protein [Chloroflexota bacterium]
MTDHTGVILEEAFHSWKDDEESQGVGIKKQLPRDIITPVKKYYVYIMSNKSGTLYTGVTNDLERRIHQHQDKTINGFTKRYKITQLIYFETTDDIDAAITREKQIKRMLRSKKIELIKEMNPQMKDLSREWFDINDASSP